MAKIIAANLDKTIELPNRNNQRNITQVIQNWFRKNKLLDESSYVEAKNGLRVFFTGISEWHFPVDVVNSKKKELALKVVPYLPDVIEKGTYKSIQALTKDRSNSRAKFIRFHLFEKRINVAGYFVTVKVKAGEYPSGKIIILPKLTAYTFVLNKISKEEKNHAGKPDDSDQPKKEGARHMQIKSASHLPADVAYDSVFDDEDQVGFEIVAIERIKSLAENTADRFFQYYG